MHTTPQTCRPVTHDDPAGFVCGRRLIDGQQNPDYGCVFWEDVNAGAVMYTFDRAGWSFCSTHFAASNPARVGWLDVHGRRFRIAGPSAAQLRKMAVAA